MTNWVGFYFDAKNRANTSETTLNDTSGSPNNVANLTLKWNKSIGGNIRNSVVVSGNYCVVGSSNSKVRSMATVDGSTRWEVTPGSGGVNGACYYDVAQIYVPSDKLYALDEATGATNWSFVTSGTVVTAPAVTGGLVIVLSSTGHLYGVPTAGGAATFDIATAVTYSGIGGAVAIYNGNAYVSMGSGVRSFNAATGAAVRTFTTRSPTLAPPCLATDAYGVTHLTVGDSWGIYDFNADTGALLWQDRQAADVTAGTPIDTVQGYAVCGTHNWSCEVHNLYSGKLRWKKDGGSGSGVNSAAFKSTHCLLPNAPTDTVGSSPTGLLFAAYMGEDNCLRCFDTQHAPGGQSSIWKYPTTVGGTWAGLGGTTDNYAGATVVNASVFIGNDGGYVYKFGI